MSRPRAACYTIHSPVWSSFVVVTVISVRWRPLIHMASEKESPVQLGYEVHIPGTYLLSSSSHMTPFRIPSGRMQRNNGLSADGPFHPPLVVVCSISLSGRYAIEYLVLAILRVGHPNLMEHILLSRILEHVMRTPSLDFGHRMISLHENPDNLRVHR